MGVGRTGVILAVGLFVLGAATAWAAEDWPQSKLDGRRSGDAPQRGVTLPLGLMAARPLSDAIFTSPVVAGRRVYVVDGAGAAWCFEADTLAPLWSFRSAGGRANCNNLSSPAVAGRYLHFGTTVGSYYVLDATSGTLVKKIDTGDPILGAPVVGGDRVYFATLGSRVYSLKADGTVCWVWDFVRERLDFAADRWSGADWLRIRGCAGWREQFCCTRDLALIGKTLVLAAGGTVAWLEDVGERAELRGTYCGQREAPATLGLSVGESGGVYRQWTRRDNEGDVEVLDCRGAQVKADHVRGTATSYQGAGLLSFSSVSIRGSDVYRCRPEHGFGLCVHTSEREPRVLGEAASIASPILLRDHAVYGGLDGRLHVVPLDGKQEAWSFKTAFGKAISAPVAVSDGRVYFGCEDGYLYALGPEGKTPLPTRDLRLHEVRSPLTGPRAGAENDWFTSFGNLANTNSSAQGLKPPLRMKWIRRYEGTSKHMSVCGAGRLYTHTAEGQIFAIEEETGRLLWRRHFPGVHVSYTSPLYCEGRLLVPQAGLRESRVRCLDAATGNLLWEAPFSGSPSWNRQQPPIVYKNLVIYLFGTGQYTPETWLFEHQSTFGFPADHKPLVRAWDLGTGREVWTRDFSEFGAGGDDAGLCLMGGKLYYSCYFGNKPHRGVTAAIEPETGKVLWSTTAYAVHAGCTVSGKDGRLYLGGYNAVEGNTNYVWCLDARDGALVWKSDPISRAIHVVTVGERFLFTHAQYEKGYVIDKESGKILSTLAPGYRCTRFTYSEPYLLGPNFALFDLSRGVSLASCGPAIDPMECIGAFASNGRVFYTTNGSGLQACLVGGDEAKAASVGGE
jgi:outer membrane protein assembly factor BamB